MNKLQRIAGLVWMPLGILLFVALVWTAGLQISANPLADTWIQWGIFVLISFPVCLGFCLFGWYAWKGDYSDGAEDVS